MGETGGRVGEGDFFRAGGALVEILSAGGSVVLAGSDILVVDLMILVRDV